MRLGIDLGGTKTEIIALDEHSKEHYRKRVPSPQGSYEKTINNLASLISEAESKLGKCESIGIGIPGALSPETGRVKNANSTWLIGHDLKQDLENKLKRQIRLANDADCFTLSEAMDGAAKDSRCVFGVILGTGVGGGICIDHNLIIGPNAITGEWGHNSLPWHQNNDQDLPCYCGKSGCIETYLSGPGMLAHYLNQHPNSEVSSAKQLIELCNNNDQSASLYFERYLDRLGRSLANVINILDPDTIVLGGGLSNITKIYQSIVEFTSPYVFSDSLNTKIVPALHGDSSGVRGAAWMGAPNQPAQTTTRTT